MEKSKEDEQQLMIVNYQGGHDGASTSSRPRFQVPPGYYFMPTDRELILEYLLKKVNNEPLPIEGISEVNLYEHPPEYLAEKYPCLGRKSWYFFTPRNRKYPKGKRPDRSVKDIGHWRATGSDKEIVSADGTTRIGFFMSLTYFEGKATDRRKTEWIMTEYKLNIPSKKPNNTSMRLDDWVLCRIHRGSKGSNSKQPDDEKVSVPAEEEVQVFGKDEDIAQLAGNNKGVEGLTAEHHIRDNSENHVGPQNDNNYNYDINQINHLVPHVDTNNYEAATRENNVVDHGWLMDYEYPDLPYTAIDYSGQALLPDMTSLGYYDQGIMPLPDMDDSILGDIDFTELDNFLRVHQQGLAAGGAAAADQEGSSSKTKPSDGVDDQHMGSKRRRK